MLFCKHLAVWEGCFNFISRRFTLE
jgi:hypothetical protein